VSTTVAEPLVTELDSTLGRADLLARFREALDESCLECLDDSVAARALYSSDSSVYRVVPTVVARPRTKDEVIRLVRAALAVGLPITGRGAGTSLCGNAVGAGLIIDMGRHMNRVLDLDPESQTAVVEPGCVQSVLQAAAAPHGLRFGPDPATSNRCTVGGMIGNNACGARALGYGRTSDNIVSLEVITGNGEVVRLGEGETPPLEELRSVVEANLAVIRTEFGTFSRQTSGYSMEHLLPERGFAVERFFAGTEGTLGIVLEAKVRLVADAPHKSTIILGYATMPDGADDIVNLLQFKPTAAEGLDERVVAVVARNKGPEAVPHLPKGQGYVIIELVSDSPEELAARNQALLDAAHCLEGWVVTDPDEAKDIWQMRTDGAGLAGVALDDPAYPSWEDAAVPADKLGPYLREFDKLLDKHHMHGLAYGHFGEGCVHCRIDFPLDKPGGSAAYRALILDAARLVASFGGSMSGEHGDGRARSETLPIMYSRRSLDMFAAVKALFDPKNLLNPGVLVDPLPVEQDLRVPLTLYSPLRKTDPTFVRDVHQCSGVAKCLANTTSGGGVMCPSYQATGDQFHSTRGRARMLQEMINGELLHGWRAPELAAALDLCVACKGCRRDCPTGIDMAAYKSRALFERYRGRLRPLRHYALGWLPRWGRLVNKVPGLGVMANLALAVPGVKHAILGLAGVDFRRPMPRFRTSGSARLGGQEAVDAALTAREERPVVAVWVDSFSDAFAGDALPALVKVLLGAGLHPQIVAGDACCGLTWITTGQLDGARAQLRRALDVLAPIAESGVPIVGMEPSCMAGWRSDAPELLPDDPRVALVAGATKTLAELLGSLPGYQVPDLTGHTIVAQPHCHHSSVLGWKADAALLKRTGAKVVKVGGCCGLAGNFGVERGHYDVSVKIFEHDLLPAIRAAGPDAILLADGFSCRKQITDLEGRQALTLAQLLAAHA
jgi:FAD/FMN-containing dehydrogenase/Fe-S oxidoreductase